MTILVLFSSLLVAELVVKVVSVTILAFTRHRADCFWSGPSLTVQGCTYPQVREISCMHLCLTELVAWTGLVGCILTGKKYVTDDTVQIPLVNP